MSFARAFFDLQIEFARRAGELADIPLPEAVRRFTNLPALIGIGGPDRDALWDDLVRLTPALTRVDDLAADLHVRYLAFAAANPVDMRRAQFGCFALEYPHRGTRKARLHFRNAEPPGVSPLSAARRQARRDELKALSRFACERCDGLEIMRGGSWLYNVGAYRRLFPPAYLGTAEVVEHEPNYMSTWGQFLAADGSVRASGAAQLRLGLSAADSVADCLAAFPLAKLQLECPYEAFVDHYLDPDLE